MKNTLATVLVLAGLAAAAGGLNGFPYGFPVFQTGSQIIATACASGSGFNCDSTGTGKIVRQSVTVDLQAQINAIVDTGGTPLSVVKSTIHDSLTAGTGKWLTASISATGTIAASANKISLSYLAGSTGRITVYGPDNSTPGAFQLVLFSADESVGDIYLSATSAGNFSTPGTWGFGTTATQQVSIHNGMNIFTAGTFSYTSSTMGLNFGYDNNTEKGWIQSVREDYAHLRELQLNPGGGLVSVGAGGISTTGSITTGAPSGGTAAAWKMGVKVVGASVVDATQYLQVDVAGTAYKVVVAQ